MKTIQPEMYNDTGNFLLDVIRCNKSLHDGLDHIFDGNSDAPSVSVYWSIYLRVLVNIRRNIKNIENELQHANKWEKI